MYQIKCDGYPIFDLRVESLIVTDPKIKVAVNTVGEGSFTIYSNHPYYDKLQMLKSVFEVSDEIGVIFRGRMTENTRDFNNGKVVDLEGAMAFFNDSVVRPFNFPENYSNDENYIAAAQSGNVIEYFLKTLIDNHNSQVQEFQQFKLGTVTVSDPNNYIVRSDSNYKTTWETLKEKLFESGLGGYLCIRYENTGNYIDYLADFELTNTQTIEFGKNLLDITTQSDASATYTAIIPLGAQQKVDDETEKRLTIEGIANGDITDDIAKSGDTLYSKSAVEKYGWIYAPVSQTTWDDVTTAENLIDNGTAYLSSEGIMMVDTIEISAVDLHFSDSEIQSFRIYRNVKVKSILHNHDDIYQLTKLDIDLLKPQNTKIHVGSTRLSLTDINSKEILNIANKAEAAKKSSEENKKEITTIKSQLPEESEKIIKLCSENTFEALKDYVKASVYDKFKETTEKQLQFLSSQLVLWSSEEGLCMTDEHTINLTGKVSDQPSGIQLVFRYDDGDELQSFFIPKQLVLLEPESKHTFNLTSGKFSSIGTKTLFVNDTRIIGHADNNLFGTSELGITYENEKFILKYVLGV